MASIRGKPNKKKTSISKKKKIRKAKKK